MVEYNNEADITSFHYQDHNGPWYYRFWRKITRPFRKRKHVVFKTPITPEDYLKVQISFDADENPENPTWNDLSDAIIFAKVMEKLK